MEQSKKIGLAHLLDAAGGSAVVEEPRGFGNCPQSDEKQYRRDIDGLRGIAILLVLIFHASSAVLPGGFVGVDVFFVISGYLITSIIIHDVLNGEFSVRRFYQSRIKRIFPSLITVFIATVLLGWLFLWRSEFRNLGNHILGGATFISNFVLWRETGYFTTQAELKPLLHLWSLGVEEQFYIVFPVCIWLVVRFRPERTTALLGGVFVLSLGASLYGTFSHPEATFYLPVTRLWELLTGCILATTQERYRKFLCGPLILSWCGPLRFCCSPATWRSAAFLFGVTMIMVVAVLPGAEHRFPGFWALLPTLGTAILIHAGEESFFNRVLLGNKALVGMGLISYPLYLWHWPLLAFARTVFGTPLTIIQLSATVSLAFVLAFLTFWYVERPVRFGGLLGRRRTFWLCSGMMIVLLTGLSVKTQILSSRLGSTAIARQLEEAVDDWDYPFQGNYKRLQGFAKDAEIGQNPGLPATVFIGDSHMQQYWPRMKVALDKVSTSTCPVILITAGGTPALPQVNRLTPGYACHKFFDFAFHEAMRTNVGTVVFCCRWRVYLGDDHSDAGLYVVGDQGRTRLRLGDAAMDGVLRTFGEAIAELVRAGKRVFVVLSSPEAAEWSPRMVPRLTGCDVYKTNRLAVLREDFESSLFFEKQLEQVVVDNGGRTINPRDAVDEGGVFYGRAVDGRFRYRDGNHMRPFYVKETASFIDGLIDARAGGRHE